MKCLIAKDNDLIIKKFSLAQVSADPELVKATVNEYLRSIVYHNLTKVNFLYECALQVPILDKTLDNEDLFRAIQYRRDCVHRNGFDTKGVELKVFTTEFLQKVSDLIKELVDKVEARL